MIHPREYAVEQYRRAIIDYCENHKVCNHCAFLDGDDCMFYVQPMYFDKAYPEENNCYSCGYGKKAVYCSHDDQYCNEADAKGECACWREKDYYATVAENAQVDHFRETTKKIELMEE